MHLVQNYLKDESGATAIEYGLIVALIGIALIGGANSLAQNINARFTNISTSASTAGP